MPQLNFKLRPMYHKDLPQVLAIERQNFPQPYSQAILEQELKIPAAHLRVATHRNKVLGYIDFWQVGDEVELVSIAVRPASHGERIGQGLMQSMFDFAKQHGAHSLLLDVRISNQRARRLYEKFGFKQVGLRKRYYSDNQEDAVIMRASC